MRDKKAPPGDGLHLKTVRCQKSPQEVYARLDFEAHQWRGLGLRVEIRGHFREIGSGEALRIQEWHVLHSWSAHFNILILGLVQGPYGESYPPGTRVHYLRYDGPGELRFSLPPIPEKALIDLAVRAGIWSRPYPLDRARRLVLDGGHLVDSLPQCAGVYIVFLEGLPVSAYVGQTKNLRQRILQLQGALGAAMPFKDPHIAGPGLWSWHHIEPDRQVFVSLAPMDGSAYWRQGIEDLVIAFERWRLASGPPLEERWRGTTSPLLNYGRIPRGYRPSSFRVKGDRGGPDALEMESHAPGIAPIGNLFEELHTPLDDQWGGHSWSPWCYASEFKCGKREQGLYRLREAGTDELFFIGHGLLGNAARDALRAPSPMLFSAVTGPWAPHQQLELVSDAIGLYLLTTATLPRAQYGGESKAYPERAPRLLPQAYLVWSHWVERLRHTYAPNLPAAIA